MKRINILLFTCLILIATPCFATIHCVSLDGWTSAPGTLYTTINAALSAASSSDEIWIKGYTNGTAYPENLSLVSGVSIKGGYTGNGSERSESYITTVFPSSGTVISVSNVSTSPLAVIEYLTIKNGNFTKGLTAGGINCISASPTIQHCHICYCGAEVASGICGDYNSSPTIEDCEIDNNSTDNGQAVVLLYNGIFRRNKIHDNDGTTQQAGGIYIGSYGGGVTVSDNHIYSNSALSSGGGIYIDNTSVTLTGNIIENNTAYYGSAIYWSKGADSGSMYNNVIKGNIYGASAIFIDTTASTSFVNNTIIGNTGDGSEITGGTLNLYNNIIANNSNYGVFTSGTIDYSYNNCLNGNGTNYNVTPSNIAGIVTTSPSFDADGYHSSSGSVCVDTGYDSAPGLQSVDLDGEPRKVDIDGAGTTGTQVDIGADEYYPDYTSSPMVDNDLPTADLNNGPGRCNIRWANSTEFTVGYGDDFTLPAGPNWVVDKLTIWAVPDIPASPEYYLGDHYQSIYLYGGAVGSAFSSICSGTFSTGSNTVSSVTPTSSQIVVTSTDYVVGEATVKYGAADGSSQQMWKVEFSAPGWTLTGGTSYSFGVMGVPRVDRLWFNHATHYASKGDGQVREFDTSSLSGTRSLVSGSAWFGGNGSDINVQIYAHPQ